MLGYSIILIISSRQFKLNLKNTKIHNNTYLSLQKKLKIHKKNKNGKNKIQFTYQRKKIQQFIFIMHLIVKGFF